MPDYNLGRAHGEVRITADVDDATRGLGEYQRATESATGAAKEQSRVERELTDRRRVATDAARRRKDAESEYKRVMADSTATAEEQLRVEEARNRARGEHLQATRRAADAERAYRAELAGNTEQVGRFIRSIDNLGDSHDRATRKIRDFRQEINETERTARILANTLQTTLGSALKGLAITGGIGIAGGAAGLLGAGGIQGLVATLGVAATLIKDFSGVVALLPASVAGLAAVLGTLAVAFNGVGDALGAAMANDPQKFAEALKNLAPAAAQAVTILASFTNAIKGAMQAVQQELFAPLVDQIQPLVTTWLPALMNAGKQIAAVFGQAGRVLAQWLQQPATMQAFQSFINNLANALQHMLPAIVPIAEAFKTLAVIGSQFFPQIADTIVRIANAFNQWVQGAAATGTLQTWIQTALNSFSQLWDIIRNLGTAFSNINALAGGPGSGFLQWLVNVTAEFKAWTESVEGAQTITAFFATLRTASDTLGPILRIIGGALLNLLNNMMQLGIQMGPGLTSFFQSLSNALAILGQVMVQSGPAFNQILTVLGDTLLKIVQQIGPQLPHLFQTFADAMTQLAPAIVAVAAGIADLAANLTPEQLLIISGIVAGFQAFGKIIPIIQGTVVAVRALGVAFAFLAANPVVLVIAAVAALAVGLVYLYNTNETFRNAVNGLWEDLKEFGNWLVNSLVNIWHTVADAVANAYRAVVEFGGNLVSGIVSAWDTVRNAVANWGNEAYQWGLNIIQSLLDGIYAMTQPIRDALGWVSNQFRDFWETHSPAKKGPLHDVSPEEMGQGVTETFASGVRSGGDSVASAASTVAGSASGGFSSAGSAGKSGGAFQSDRGRSGFDAWISAITQDLQAWLSLVRNSFGLFEKVADIFVQSSKVVASLWNQGDNPLTRPGGIFSESAGLTPEQQLIPGVENVTPAGKAPLPELTPQGNQPKGTAPVVPQANVPGVPTPVGTQPAPVAPAPAPAPAPALPGPGSAPLPTPATGLLPTGVVNEGGKYRQVAGPQDITNAIVAKGKALGLNDEQIRGAVIAAAGESNLGQNVYGGDQGIGGAWGVYQQGNAYGAVADRQDPNKAIDQFMNLYAGQLKAQPALTPLQVATGVQQHGGPGAPGMWQGTQGDQWYLEHNFNQNARDTAEKYLSSVSGGNVGVPQPQKPYPAPTSRTPPGTVAITPGGTPIIGMPPGGLPDDFTGTRLIDQNTGLPIPGPGQASSLPGAQRERRGTPTSSARPSAPFTSVPYGLAYDTDTGGYGSGSDKFFPQWVMDLAAQYNVKPSTYPGHQTSNRTGANGVGFAPNPQNLNRGIDWVGSREDMQRFAEALVAYGGAEGGAGPLEMVIYQAGPGGKKYGLGGAGNVQESYYPQSGEGSYDQHGGMDTGAHVHTRFSGSVPSNLGAQQVGLTGFGSPLSTQTTSTNSDWMRAPQGWDIKNPIPLEVRRQHGIPDELPPMFYAAQPGTVTNVVAPPGYAGGTPVSPAGTISVPLPGVQPGFPSTQAQQGPFAGQSPIQSFQTVMNGASSIAGDAFAVFDNVIKSIGAAANLTDTMVRGFENTQDVMGAIDQIQQFIATAASVAKLVSSTTGVAAGLAAAGAGADPTGGASGAAAGLQAASAIAGLVQSSLEATNMVIDLGQEAWKQISKYGAMIVGSTLGGEQGMLSGNVRMLLNTATNEVYAYSEDNPQNKTTHQLPMWMSSSYGGTRPELQQPRLAQVNIYAGPGQTPQAMMQESMWLVGTGGSSVVSVSGHE